ncbi:MULTISPECIES: FtsK/SpoIIIE domain-containing protein [unclassified Roseofilum]|uniref:FtsK/SpoIIIE domain-containing protein n=1 Tax=unclassified Roseofilum TaxID=2620099 RepID=UPI00298E5A32|nr:MULTISPECIES: FtsK/SpoIIIE domain-containing protein [unclassified Roseofilum]
MMIDPVSMGNNFPFKELPDFISGLKTYTRSDDIREQLRALTVHIEQVIQNYLGRNYDSIEIFNAAKSSVEEPYRYLFLADFPTNFDGSSWEDLKSLLVNGAKAGVYAIIHVDGTLETPKRDMDYRLFESYCTVLQPSGKSEDNHPLFEVQFPNGCLCEVSLDEPPPNDQFNQLTGAIAKAFKEVKTETVSFAEFYPHTTHPDKRVWSADYYSGCEVRAPIGVMGARENLEFWLGTNEDALVVSQGLLAGKPGAGKSYTLHAIIISLAMRYSPDELQMYLLDFKEGVEFQIYVDPERSDRVSLTEELNEEKALPHARVVSIESDREFGLSVLQTVQAEIEQRGSQFKSVGVSNLTDYREKCPDVKMPRILVVIDEFQYMFQDRDKITSELNLIFEDITRRGRAFGVHLLIASQSPNVPNMSRGIYSFIELRMAQQMDKNTANSVLAEGNVDAVDLLEKPGKVIYNKDFGRKGHNEIGQVADMSLPERMNALLEIQNTARDNSYQRSEPLILFNGSRPTQLSHNRQLRQLSQRSDWLSLRDLNKQAIQEPDWLVEETPGVAWLGEAMRIGDHTKAIFRRRSRSNMLLVGTSEEMIFGIIGGILLSLVHTYQPQQAEFQIIDLCQDSEDTPWASMSVSFRRLFAQYFPIAIGKRFPNPGDRIIRGETILQNVYEEWERRQKYRDEHPDELDLGPSLFLIYAIGSLSRAQNL